MFQNVGDVCIEEADEMNIPVNIFLTEIDEDEEVDSLLRCNTCGLRIADDCLYHFPALENSNAVATFDPQSTYGPLNLAICEGSRHEPERIVPKYRLSARNFMPRKERIGEGGYDVVSDSQDELRSLVEKHVQPLFEVAFRTIPGMITGETDVFYYWQQHEPRKLSPEAHSDGQLSAEPDGRPATPPMEQDLETDDGG